MPAGVWVSALVTRLPTTWRSRASSPSTTSGRRRAADVQLDGAVRRDRVGRRAPRRGQHRAARPGPAADRPLLVQPGQQQQVLDEQAHPGRLVLDAAQHVGRVRSAAPCRYSSAKPRIVVSGVRSSCEASATNWRIRSSERTARASDACAGQERRLDLGQHRVQRGDSWPSSVRGSSSGTRRVRSPPAIAAAVRSISTSGRRLARTTPDADRGRATISTAAPTSSSTRTSRSTALSTSVRFWPSEHGRRADLVIRTRQRTAVVRADGVTARPGAASSRARRSATAGRSSAAEAHVGRTGGSRLAVADVATTT